LHDPVEVTEILAAASAPWAVLGTELTDPATALERAGELPAVADALRRLGAATAHWRTEGLPCYPAFSG
jgi:hypothetical protein